MYTVDSIKKKGDRFIVTIIGDDTHTISLDEGAIIEYALMRGASLSDDTVDAVLELDERYRAYLKVLRILSYGDKSQRALKDRLIRDGFSTTAAEDAILMAIEYGYVNERRQIKSIATRLANRDLRSPKFIVAKLSGDGYDEALVESVVYSLTLSGEVDFNEVGERLCRKLGITDPDERRILLIKRGFIEED